jgi:hypothetical protein
LYLRHRHILQRTYCNNPAMQRIDLAFFLSAFNAYFRYAYITQLRRSIAVLSGIPAYKYSHKIYKQGRLILGSLSASKSLRLYVLLLDNDLNNKTYLAIVQPISIRGPASSDDLTSQWTCNTVHHYTTYDITTVRQCFTILCNSVDRHSDGQMHFG